MKEKLKSPVVWTSLVAIIVPLIAMKSGALGDNFNTIATAIIAAFSVLGILNNPNDRENL